MTFQILNLIKLKSKVVQTFSAFIYIMYLFYVFSQMKVIYFLLLKQNPILDWVSLISWFFIDNASSEEIFI